MASNGLMSEMRERVKIDRNDLDTAVAEQPECMRDVGLALTGAMSTRDQLKEDLQILKAETSVRLRKELEAAKEKVTEGLIAARIDANKEVRRASNALLDVVREVGEWQAIRESWVQREKMLKVLADLHGQSYWSRDSLRHNAENNRRMEEHAERKARIAKARKKGKR